MNARIPIPRTPINLVRYYGIFIVGEDEPLQYYEDYDDAVKAFKIDFKMTKVFAKLEIRPYVPKDLMK